MAIETFRTIALGEFIPYGIVIDPLKDLLKGDPDESGEDKDSKANVLVNMGVMLAVLLLMILIVVVVVILVRFCKPGSKLHNFAQKVKKKLFWNGLLRSVL